VALLTQAHPLYSFEGAVQSLSKAAAPDFDAIDCLPKKVSTKDRVAVEQQRKWRRWIYQVEFGGRGG